MSKTDSADHIRFLISCVGHCTGKPDFDAVAKDLGIVSKAAAQKRFERMVKANNESPKPASKASDSEDKAAETPTKKRKTAAATATAPAAPGSAQKRRGRPPKNKSNGVDEQPVQVEEKKDIMKDDAEDSPLSEPLTPPSPDV